MEVDEEGEIGRKRKKTTYKHNFPSFLKQSGVEIEAGDKGGTLVIHIIIIQIIEIILVAMVTWLSPLLLVAFFFVLPLVLLAFVDCMLVVFSLLIFALVISDLVLLVGVLEE